MAEISPPEFRGALMAMEQFSIVLGCVLGFWAGFFTRGGTSVVIPDMLPPDCTFTMSSPTYSIRPTEYITNVRFDMITLHGD